MYPLVIFLVFFFRVSAKFEGVGEGAMSHPEGFDRHDAEDVCMTGMYFPF